MLAFGALVGFVLTMNSPDWYYSFVSDTMAGSRSPTAETETLRAALYDSDDTAIDSLNLFASFLFSHNAKIGLLSFALGFAFGVPTVLLLFVNGLTLGAFAALYASRGLSWDLWAWLMIHGTTELLALALCGGAGLVLGVVSGLISTSSDAPVPGSRALRVLLVAARTVTTAYITFFRGTPLFVQILLVHFAVMPMLT